MTLNVGFRMHTNTLLLYANGTQQVSSEYILECLHEFLQRRIKILPFFFVEKIFVYFVLLYSYIFLLHQYNHHKTLDNRTYWINMTYILHFISLHRSTLHYSRSNSISKSENVLLFTLKKLRSISIYFFSVSTRKL